MWISYMFKILENLQDVHVRNDNEGQNEFAIFYGFFIIE